MNLQKLKEALEYLQRRMNCATKNIFVTFVTQANYTDQILGGPGGSGVALALREAEAIQTVASAGYDDETDGHLVESDSVLYYDVLSWDPR